MISANAESALERAQPFQTKWFTTTVAGSLTGVTNVTQGETLASAVMRRSRNLYRSGKENAPNMLARDGAGRQTMRVGTGLPDRETLWITGELRGAAPCPA